MKEGSKFIITRIPEFNELEEDLINFFKTDNSFLGWLLTLNDKEFKEVYYTYSLEDRFYSLICLTKGIFTIGQEYTFEGFKEIYSKMQVNVELINLVKLGLVQYSTNEDDDKWTFQLTEKGKQEAERILLENPK